MQIVLKVSVPDFAFGHVAFLAIGGECCEGQAEREDHGNQKCHFFSGYDLICRAEMKRVRENLAFRTNGQCDFFFFCKIE